MSAALNRAVLMRVFAHLRRSARVEVMAIVGIVVAVAILTELAPGRKAARSLAAAPSGSRDHVDASAA